MRTMLRVKIGNDVFRNLHPEDTPLQPGFHVITAVDRKANEFVVRQVTYHGVDGVGFFFIADLGPLTELSSAEKKDLLKRFKKDPLWRCSTIPSTDWSTAER